MTFAEQLKDEFKKTVIETVLANGEPVDVVADRTGWGWLDGQARKHIRGYGRGLHTQDEAEPCRWVPTRESDFKEVSVYEAQDTFNNSNKTMIDVDCVDCVCGKYRNMKIRYEGLTQNFIPLMFMEPHNFIAH